MAYPPVSTVTIIDPNGAPFPALGPPQDGAVAGFELAPEGTEWKFPARTKVLRDYMSALPDHGAVTERPADESKYVRQRATEIANAIKQAPRPKRRWEAPNDASDIYMANTVDRFRTLSLTHDEWFDTVRSIYPESEFSDEQLIEAICEKRKVGKFPADVEREDMAKERRSLAASKASKAAWERAAYAAKQEKVTTTPADLRNLAIMRSPLASESDPVVKRLFNEHTRDRALMSPEGWLVLLCSAGPWAYHMYGRIDGVGSSSLALGASDMKITATQAQLDAAKVPPSANVERDFDNAIRASRRELAGRTDVVKREDTHTETTDRGRYLLHLLHEAIKPWKHQLLAFTHTGAPNGWQWLAYFVEYAIRGLLIRDEVAHETLMGILRDVAKEQGAKITDAQWDGHDDHVTRLIRSRAEGGEDMRIALGEFVPSDESLTLPEGSDPWTVVLSTSVGSGDSFEPETLRKALSEAGVTMPWSRLFSGRLTKTMTGLGFVKTVVDGKKLYVRQARVAS